jgi:hypothetical protein
MPSPQTQNDNLALIDAEIAKRDAETSRREKDNPRLALIDAELAKRNEEMLPSIASRNAEIDARVREQADSISPILDTARGVGELGVSMVTGAGAEVFGGIAGTIQSVNPFAEKGSGARTVEAFQDAAYQPKERGQEVMRQFVGAAGEIIPDPIKEIFDFVSDKITQLESFAEEKGGPLAATVVATLPTFAAEVIPGGAALRKARQLRRSTDTPNSVDAPEVAPEQRSYEQIADDLKAGRESRVAEEVRPDQQILDDAAELGVDLNPSHYSTNRAFIDLEQSLKSRPGSKLSVVEEKAIITLGDRADELIDDLGGSTDKSLLDADIRGDLTRNINALNDLSDNAYGKVDAAIPLTTRTNPSNTRDFINEQLANLGGDKKLLTSAERSLLNLVEKNPTYAALDRLRKDIGSAIGRGKGRFKDDDIGQLRQLYRVLSDDQQGVADAFGVGEQYAAARKLVQTRKEIEDQAVTLFGREVNGSIIPLLRQSANNLTKGDVSKLNKLMESVPVGRRAEVAATMLNDIFTSGARRNAPLGQGFINAFEGLSRNAGAKEALFRHLPADARRRFDMIGRVSTGLYKAKSLENTSKTARDVISAMDSGGMFGKIYGTGAKIAVAEGASGAIGLPGAGATGVLVSIFLKAKTAVTETADELLSSRDFFRAVTTAASGDLSAAEQIISKSGQFRSWLTAQPPSIKAEIAAIGFIPWLTNNSETEQPESNQQAELAN